ncbi:MAG: cache domain-containing protein [Firmicutes bacterium]|nr:cache domain-containing protein [Bacillota bacterium]
MDGKKYVKGKIDDVRARWRFARYMRSLGPRSIQATISVSFTIVALVCMLSMGIALYQRFAIRSEKMLTDTSELLLDQTAVNLEDYLRSMRRISDAIYYNVIKDQDISKDSPVNQMDLLYEAHKDYLISLALYTEYGTLVSASPVGVEKENLDVTEQTWFKVALERPENLHFSLPHVQNIFVDDPTFRYYWVTSLSRAVELNNNGVPGQGVLLLDMNYDVIEQMMEDVNDNPSEHYVYLCDDSGTIIYHPMLMQISAGLMEENNNLVPTYDEGSHEEEFLGSMRIVTV